MKKAAVLLALLATAPAASAADSAISAGLFGGALFTDQLEVLGDTVVVSPRFGYWVNPTLGVELDLSIMPAGQTQVGVPDTFGYFGLLPAANLVGRVFEDQPVSLLLNVGVGPFFKSIADDGELGLPTGDKLDVDLAGISGPGVLVPFGNVALRTDYRWLLNIGSESYQNRGDAFIDGMWTLGVMYLPMGPRDADKDGIVDEDDRCIDQPEDIDEFEDMDGCPDPDNDGDGIADVQDGCANDAEDMDEFQDEDGCPEADNDEDGVLDEADLCPVDAGPEATKGCPDGDEDGLADADDECPEEKGPLESFGCPDGDGDHVPDFRDDCPEEAAPVDLIDPRRSDGCVKKAYIGEDKIIITDKVFFITGKATIQSKSNDLLDSVAKLLEKFKGIKSIQIEGHTDSDGKDDDNLELSQGRADAVKAYLVGKGIAEERLVAKGFGETKPVGDNATKEGKEQNRRVEFNILEQDVGKGLKKKLKEKAQDGDVEKAGEGAEAPAEEKATEGAKKATEEKPAEEKPATEGAKKAPAAEEEPAEEKATEGAKPAPAAEEKPAEKPAEEPAPAPAPAPEEAGAGDK